MNDAYELVAGDSVVGILPADLIARINGQGVRYIHLCVTIPQALRGQELSIDTLDELGATLQELVVTPVGERLARWALADVYQAPAYGSNTALLSRAWK